MGGSLDVSCLNGREAIVGKAWNCQLRSLGVAHASKHPNGEEVVGPTGPKAGPCTLSCPMWACSWQRRQLAGAGPWDGAGNFSQDS